MRRTYVPARDTASLPPVCSASALVLMMCRIGFELSFAIAASSSSLTAAVCVSTTTTASCPTCTVVLPPGPAIMNTLPCAGRTSSSVCAKHGRGGREGQQSRRSGIARIAATLLLIALHLRRARLSSRAYSGYIVCAPPRAASTGNPWRCEYSSRNEFVPGKWCGTVPRGRSISIAGMHENGLNCSPVSRTQSEVRTSGSVR